MLTVVIGPPCAGKSTWARAYKGAGDIVVDFDAIASALGAADHRATDEQVLVAVSARRAAIRRIRELGASAIIIECRPYSSTLATYAAWGARFVLLDPGEEECVRRAEADGRPSMTIAAIRDWYASPPDVGRYARGVGESKS